MNSTAFDVYYEHLLLLSFWSDVKNEVEPVYGIVEWWTKGLTSPVAAIQNMNNP
jgi:hypothetical protein